MRAAQNGHLAVIEYLVGRGANVDVTATVRMEARQDSFRVFYYLLFEL